MPQRVFHLVAACWTGSMLAVGYLAAPTLFASLDRSTAGNVAAMLFRNEAVLGVVCGLILLGLANALVRQGYGEYRRARAIVGAMLACLLVGYFAVQPFMAALRDAARDAGVDVGHSRYATRFAMLHGVSSAIYLVQTALGIWLVWRQAPTPGGARDARAASTGA
jgi:hypothetical protein